MNGKVENSYTKREVVFTVSAPGKLLLFGEHSVVYGKSAVAAGINKRTFLKLSENVREKIFTIRMKEIDLDCSLNHDDILNMIKENIPCSSGDILDKLIDPSDIDHDKFVSYTEGYIKTNLKHCLKDMTKQQLNSILVFLYILHGMLFGDESSGFLPLNIEVTSELSVGAGTGSSASFCVCIAAALFYYKNVKKHGSSFAETLTFSEEGLNVISKWAFAGERILHGKPSGIDNTVTTFGSFIEVKTPIDPVTKTPRKLFKKLSCPPKMNVLLINTGILRNTWKMVEKVSVLKSEHSTIVNLLLDGMHEISLKAIEIFNNVGQAQVNQLPVFSQLETLVDMNQGLLYSLGVSHDHLQHICLICSRHGLHAKLTGAGGGGYAFAIVPPYFDSKELAECISELQSKGYSMFSTELGSDGVRLEK